MTSTAAPRAASLARPGRSAVRVAEVALLVLLIVGVWVGSTRRAGVILVSDFVATYVGLEIVTSDDPSALYDLDRQIGLQRDIYPEIEDGAAYMNPPFYLAPLLPLAALSFDQAMFVVAVLNTALIVWWARTASRDLLAGRWSWPRVALVALVCFPCLVTIGLGQNSIVSLVLLTSALGSFRVGRPVAAGLALGSLAYKPQLLIVLVPLLVVKRQWRTLAVTAATAAGAGLVSLAMVGWSGVRSYADFVLFDSPLEDGHYGIDVSTMHNWRGFFRVLLGPGHDGLRSVLVVVAVAITLALLVQVWRNRWDPGTPAFALRLAATVCAAQLVSPHLYTHDLSLSLLVGALWIGAATMAAKESGGLGPGLWVGAAVFVGWASLPVAAIAHVQITTLALLAALVTLVRLTTSGTSAYSR